MTDYNDGNWHGWNCGKCPVHPLSVVEFRNTHGYSEEGRAAGNLAWDDPLLFRVTSAHVGRRVMWVWKGCTFDTREAAETWRDRMSAKYPDCGYADMPITKWQEVPE